MTEYEQNLEQAKEYLQARGILHATAVKFRLGVVPETSTEYAGRLAIPSIGPYGNIYNIRYRRIINGDSAKYMGMPGFETRLFNVRAIREAYDFIAITEGEMDAIVLEQCGIPAVGVCGANGWKAHHPEMFGGFQKVFIFGDGDEPGQKFAAKVNDSLLSGVRVKLQSGHDVNDVLLEQGPEALREMVGLDA